MDLSPYLETVRQGVTSAAALGDDTTRQVADRLGGAVEASTRLALIRALSDAAAQVSAEVAPTSVELRMSGAEPELVVVVPAPSAEPTLLLPDHAAAGDDEPPELEGEPVEVDDEPVARVSLRLPASVKSRVDEKAARDGHLDQRLAAPCRDGRAWRTGPIPPVSAVAARSPPIPGDNGPFGPYGVFGPNGPFGPGGVFGGRGRRHPDLPGGPPTAAWDRAGLGPMTARTFDAIGVRAIVVDNLGRGSLTLEAGPRDDVVEGTVSADEELLQETSIRHEADTLRIWFPDQLFRSRKAHIRIGVPTGIALTARTGSADVTASVPLGRSRLSTGSGEVDLAAARGPGRHVRLRFGVGGHPHRRWRTGHQRIGRHRDRRGALSDHRQIRIRRPAGPLAARG